jgi:hypothetical protein
MNFMNRMLLRVVRPLQSRKVRVAVATVVAAYLAEYGLNVSEEIVLTIVGMGVSLILGIALEDAGSKSTAGPGSRAGNGEPIGPAD